MIVCDSSPLIMLAKEGLLSLLKKCFQKAVIPKSVYEEVTQKRNSTEVIALEKAIKEGWAVVEEVEDSPAIKTNVLNLGERDAISLAAKHKSMLLIDDDSAKKYASLLNVESHGTLFVIYLACIRKFIEKEEAIDALEDMIAEGFYISTNVYRRFIEAISSIKR